MNFQPQINQMMNRLTVIEGSEERVFARSSREYKSLVEGVRKDLQTQLDELREAMEELKQSLSAPVLDDDEAGGDVALEAV